MKKDTSSPAYVGRVKYTEDAAAKYQHRPPRKHAAELKLVTRALDGIPPGTALDAPCGGGRMSLLLAEHGFKVTAADLSPAMIEIAREKTAPRGVNVVSGDVEALTFPDRHFDVVLCFRLFQHFPNADIRARVAKELCRVSRSYVLLSYFSPLSTTAMKRALQEKFLGKKRTKFHNSLTEIRGYFEPCGFELVRDHAQLRGVHALHLAVFRRRAA